MERHGRHRDRVCVLRLPRVLQVLRMLLRQRPVLRELPGKPPLAFVIPPSSPYQPG